MLGRNRKSSAAPPAAPAIATSKVLVAVSPAAATAAERAAAVEIALNGARTDLATAEAGLAAAHADYDTAVDRAAIEDALAARPRIAEAQTVVDVAQRLVDRLAADHTEACQGAAHAAALAEREHFRVEAEEAARLYEVAFREDMPAAVARVRKVLRLWAVAELARERAADVGVALPRIDNFRDVAGRPREVIREWTRDLWVRSDGTPFEGKYQDEIKLEADGTGRLYGHAHTTTVTKKRRFAFTEYQPRVDTEIAPLLARELAIPALFATEPAGFMPPRDSYDARSILQRLDKLEAPTAPPAEPATKIDRKPIEPAREVKVVREPRESVFTRIMSGF